MPCKTSLNPKNGAIMKYKKLGKTNILVSNLSFGALTISPLQVNLNPIATKELLLYAYERGINFYDTAEFYQNYQQLKDGLDNHINDVVICAKTYAYTAQQARASVNKALKELGRNTIDIFCLHEQESELTLRGHQEAIVELMRCKDEGLIRAIGISTHHIAAAKAVLDHPEIEIVMTVVNYQGLGIVDGSLAEMLSVIKELKKSGKGVYGMKALGGGNLNRNVEEAFSYVRDLTDLDSVALGMQTIEEVDIAVGFWEGYAFNSQLQSQVSSLERSLHVAEWCSGCGRCVDRCDHRALQIKLGVVSVDQSKCLRCGYCSTVCPEFCLKIY